MKKIKILQVNKLYYPVIGGIKNLVRDIAEGINQSSENMAVDVLVCQEKGKFEECSINGVKVYKASSFGVKFSLPLSLHFFSLFRKICNNYDIIHFHMPFPIGDLALLLSNYNGKVVLGWHSDVVRQKKALVFYKPILNRFLKRADLIVVATPNHISSSKFINTMANKCKIIPYGIKTKDFVNINQEIATKIQEHRSSFTDTPILLFVGRLVYYKGLEVLIKAMQFNDATLIILGEGPLKSNLVNLSTELGISDRIIFIGKQNDENMISWYHACDIFILPSIANSEAFGLVQLEAMICGKPVINTSLPTGVPFVSLDGLTGYTVPPNDVKALSEAINKLLTDKEKQLFFGRNAIERVTSIFTNEQMIDSLINLYKNLLS